MKNDILFALKDKLSKEDYDIAVSIALTPFEEIYADALRQWRNDDFKQLQWLKTTIQQLDKLYVRYIFSEPQRAKQIEEIVLDLCLEKEELNDRLYPKSQTDKRIIKWH